MEAGTFEIIQHSVLITIPGRDPALKPLLLMAHQDVVPVVAGTEDSWEYPPFEATLDETFIWGRGSMDIKLMVIGELEAAEYVLAHGKAPLGWRWNSPRREIPRSRSRFVAKAAMHPTPLEELRSASFRKRYDPVCDTCLRMSPFLHDDDEQARGVHGTNECVTRRSYLHGIRFLIALIEHVCL